MATATEAVRRSSYWPEWIAFLTQCLIAGSVELGDDLGRGLISQHGTVQGIDNARQIVTWESAHGLWVEPSWQLFFERTHHVLMLTITWAESSRIFDGIYILGRLFVTLGIAAWVYFFHRRFFPLLRNTVILANALALVIYETYPVAPPRMMPALPFNHQLFTFQDTLYGVLTAGGQYVGTSVTLAYNEFSAMPSVHMAWALAVSAAVVLLARPWPLKLLGVVYPALMLVAVVVTANHFLLDAIAAVFVVALAAAIAVGIEAIRGKLPWQVDRAAA